MPGASQDEEAPSPWLLRLELDCAKMLGRALEIEHVERVLQESLPEQDLNIVRATAAKSYDNNK